VRGKQDRRSSSHAAVTDLVQADQAHVVKLAEDVRARLLLHAPRDQPSSKQAPHLPGQANRKEGNIKRKRRAALVLSVP
jgi:hypothetical protein